MPVALWFAGRSVYQYAAHALQAFERLDVGGVVLNDVPACRMDYMPYGGVKDSGLGREGPRYAIKELTELELLVVNQDY